MNDQELSPTPEHLEDPYILQLIETLSKLEDDNLDMADKLERAESILKGICIGLDEAGVPMPPELLDWWIQYQNEDGPKIHVIQ